MNVLLKFSPSETEKQQILDLLAESKESLSAAADKIEELKQLLEAEHLSICDELRKALSTETERISSAVWGMKIQRVRLEGQGREIS